MNKCLYAISAFAALILLSSSAPAEEKSAKAAPTVPIHKDLQTVIENSADCDILIYGEGKWHHIDRKDKKQETKVYVLPSAE